MIFNTATVFNKINKYQREGGYKWLQDMLDFKYHAVTPRELIPLSSSAAKRIATPALIDIGDPAMDKSRENAVAASSEELVSGVEAAIGRLKENQENVYNDIWVKAQKGSGKDINEELFKWLRAQMPARKDELEAVGVNQDLIRYTRLLLSEKMAPVIEVPSDIKEMVARLSMERKQRENPALTFLSQEDKNALMSIALNNIPDSDPKYQKVMRGIYENYTSEQVKSIFDWYLKYKNKVGGLLEKPLENIQAPYTAKVEKTSLADINPPKSNAAKNLKWVYGIYNGDKYEVFENGDKPIGTQATVYIDGKPIKAGFVADGNGLNIILNNGEEYGIPFDIDSAESAKESFEIEYSGKSNEIVKEFKDFHGVNFSFIDPAKTKFDTDSLKTAKEISESESSPKFPITKFNDSTITAFKNSLYDTENEKFTVDDFFALLSQYEESGHLNYKEKTAMEYWAVAYQTWTQNKTPAQIADDKYSHISKPNQKQEPQKDIEDFWPKSLNFMSPSEIDYVKQSIKDAIAAGNNSNTWLNKFEMYGNKATHVYSPESQNELKKLFDAEAKKIQGTNRLKIADAENYFQKAIENDANYGWKEIVDINSDWPQQLVDSLFQYGQTTRKKPKFSSLPQTLSIGERTYTAYTPNKGGDIFILYGDYNNSGENMNYNWIGAAQFKTANRTEDEIISELSEWLKGEVDYYDPQI